jgi:hypothetical protein
VDVYSEILNKKQKQKNILNVHSTHTHPYNAPTQKNNKQQTNKTETSAAYISV